MELMKSQYSEDFSNLGNISHLCLYWSLDIVKPTLMAIFLLIIGKHMQILAHAASGYHKVLEENRKLYNHVQDLKGGIANFLTIILSL